MNKDYVPPENKAESEIVQKAESYAMQHWTISSRTYREFLAPFRAIQAEIDCLKEKVHTTLINTNKDSDFHHSIEGRVWKLEHPDKPKTADLATDKNGHPLQFGDVVSYLNYKEEKRFGIFHHEETGDIWAYWFRPFASELTGETTYMDKDCVTFEFRPERPEQDC